MSPNPSAPFGAYHGDDPYLFVSYSHKDKNLVYPEILRLHKQGYRIWYDEGITPGSDLSEKIGLSIKKCSYFIIFISLQSVESHHVRNEISLATNRKIPILPIYLEETELPEGLQLIIGRFLFIKKYQMSEKNYYKEMESIPDNLVDKNFDKKIQELNNNIKKLEAKNKKFKKNVLLLSLFLIPVILVIGFWSGEEIAGKKLKEKYEKKINLNLQKTNKEFRKVNEELQELKKDKTELKEKFKKNEEELQKKDKELTKIKKILSIANSNIKNSILLVGSGTMYKYLARYAPKILESKANVPKVLSLSAGTETGIRVLTEAASHGKYDNSFNVLAMAARSYELEDFINRRDTDRFFEIKIGSGYLTAVFGARNKMDFKSFFKQQEKFIFDCNFSEVKKCIPISEIYPLVWTPGEKNWSSRLKAHPYRVYSGYMGSGTHFLFERELRKYAKKIGDTFTSDQTGWPEDLHGFVLDISELVDNRNPWIALGGQLFDNDSLKPLSEKAENFKIANIIGTDDKPIYRGLFLYGRLPKPTYTEGLNPEARYYLKKEVCLFINGLFDSLKRNVKPSHLIKELLKPQEDFLNLSQDKKNKCWIKKQLYGNSQLLRSLPFHED